MTRELGTLVLALVISGCFLPTGISSEWSGVIEAEWRIGQKNVYPLVGDKAYKVDAHNFHWKEEDAPFHCVDDDFLYNGCFWASRKLIAWNIHTPVVIRLEAGHAILWKLKHPEWITFPHRDRGP